MPAICFASGRPAHLVDLSTRHYPGYAEKVRSQFLSLRQSPVLPGFPSADKSKKAQQNGAFRA